MFRIKNIAILAVLLALVALFAVTVMAQDKDQPSTGTTPVTPSQPVPAPDKGKLPEPTPPPAVPAPNPNENQATPTAMPGAPSDQGGTTPVIPPPPIKKGILDGKIFEGTMTLVNEANSPQQPGVSSPEVIAFKNGMIIAVLLEPEGYKAGAYATTKSGAKINFTASIPKGDEPGAVFDWTGVVTADKAKAVTSVNATVKLVRGKTVVHQYAITGMMKAPVSIPTK